MDGTDSNFLPNKKLCGKEFVDRISALPDEIILIILSSLSLWEAAATSVLSSRWSDLWKHIPNLDFFTDHIPRDEIPENEHISWDAENCKYVKMVNSVIQSHKALTLQRCRIRFYVNKSAQSTVTKWLEFASSRKVKTLELNLECWGDSHLVPLENSLSGISSSFEFESLARLILKCVVVSGEDISLFLDNCPFLRVLVIHYSVLASDIDVRGDALALEALDIRYCCVRGKRVRISAPNLTSVWIEARSKKRLLFANVPKLVTVNCIIGGREDRVQQFASLVSCITSQLRILTITLNHSQRLWVSDEFPKMANLKNLTVIDRGEHEHGGLLPVTELIWASPRLEVFKLRCSGEIKDPTSHIKLERSPHQHLKMFDYKGPNCGGVKDPILELATYISNNCAALQKIILGPHFQVKLR